MRLISTLRLIAVVAMISLSYQSKGGETKFLPRDVKNISDWVITSADNRSQPFIIASKKEQKIFVFLDDGSLYGSSPVLMGITIGDDTSPGVGQKKLSQISIKERTTPAGRFEAQVGLALDHSDLLWIDYDSGLSLHPVIVSNPSEHRIERLSSLNATDHRISYGCINVPGNFYKEVVHPIFKIRGGIVYILPEKHSILSVFGPEAAKFSQRE